MAPKGKGHQSWMLLAQGLRQLLGLVCNAECEIEAGGKEDARCRTRVATKEQVSVTGAFRESHSREGCLA